MRPIDPRAVLPRRGTLACAFAVTAALLAFPVLAPEAEAASRSGKAQAEQAHPRRAAATPARAARSKPAASPARSTARRAPAKPGKSAQQQAAARPKAATPAEEAVPGVRPIVVSALDRAVRSTGIEPALLAALAWQESRFDPQARNGRSTARGLMQFTESTWLQAVRDHGAQHGLAYEASMLTTDAATGTISVRKPKLRARILELRNNPRYAAALAAQEISRARAALELALMRPVGPADLYLVHLLGPAGAQRFLTALDRTPNRPAVQVVGSDSVALNRELFADRESKKPLTLAEVHAWIARSIAAQREMNAPLLIALGARPVVEVADAR
nr:transglycosylase SLT domain-containing protein [Roseicella sp. DB1501]